MPKYNLRKRNTESFPILPEEIQIEPQYPFDLVIKEEIPDYEENVYDNQIAYNEYYTLEDIKQEIENDTKNIHRCQICNKQFKYRTSLIRHRHSHSEQQKVYECELCNKQYTRKEALVLHNSAHHSKNPSRSFQCDMCDKTFVLKRYLHYHRKTHFNDRKFECGICTKRFLHRWHLLRHNLQHTGEKPFKCDVCDKTFTRSTGVTRHKKNTPCQLEESI